MKKLLLGLILFLSLSMSAQRAQFIENYERVTVMDSTQTVLKSALIPTRVFFNYAGNNDKIKIYFNDKVYLLTQEYPTEFGETEAHEQFQAFIVYDESCNLLLLQYFIADGLIRIIDEEGMTLQLENEQ